MSDAGHGDLAALLTHLRQGDLLDVAKLTTLWSPDAPSYPQEVAGVPHEEPVMTVEVRLASGLCAVISQDCDLRRPPTIEPFVAIAPMSEVDDVTYREASDGLSGRYFAFPDVTDSRGRRLVLDVRAVCSIEKTALLSPHVRRTPCPLTEPARTRLREWLGNRFGRRAFPDEIVRQVVEPVERAIKRTRQNAAMLHTSGVVVYWGIRWMPGSPNCSLLALTDPGLRARRKVGEPELSALRTRLQKALDHFAREGDYSIKAYVHDADAVSAREMLEFAEIPVDLGPLET
ncbi:MAG: hypothetical protein AB1416_06155 [Actinomycetota bacterium]